MTSPRCTVCFEKATQRIVKPSVVGFRCDKHKATKKDAKAFGWKLFELTDQETRKQ